MHHAPTFHSHARHSARPRLGRGASRALALLGLLPAVLALAPAAAAADNPAGAPASGREAGQANAALAHAARPFGQVVSPVAQAGLVDDLSLLALGLTPPRGGRR